jgi:hypothetical protein
MANYTVATDGRRISSHIWKPSEWLFSDIPPDSIAEKLMSIVCKK